MTIESLRMYLETLLMFLALSATLYLGIVLLVLALGGAWVAVLSLGGLLMRRFLSGRSMRRAAALRAIGARARAQMEALTNDYIYQLHSNHR